MQAGRVSWCPRKQPALEGPGSLSEHDSSRTGLWEPMSGGASPSSQDASPDPHRGEFRTRGLGDSGWEGTGPLPPSGPLWATSCPCSCVTALPPFLSCSLFFPYSHVGLRDVLRSFMAAFTNLRENRRLWSFLTLRDRVSEP